MSLCISVSVGSFFKCFSVNNCLSQVFAVAFVCLCPAFLYFLFTYVHKHIQWRQRYDCIDRPMYLVFA